jgi:hypothetical protein
MQVPESAEPMRVLMRAEATDGDRSSANRRLRYRLAQLSPLLEGSEPVLGVNSRTGDVNLGQGLSLPNGKLIYRFSSAITSTGSSSRSTPSS